MARPPLTATQPRRSPSTTVELDVCIGKAELAAGKLVFAKKGARVFSQFAYSGEWLRDRDFFDLSPDLQRTAGYHVHKPRSADESAFFLALADTEPDAWGRRVISRAHARRRKTDPALGELTELDFLCAVDDESRVGALRLRDGGGRYLTTAGEGERATPPLVELAAILGASRRLELSRETAEDLKYLRGKGTSLGGMRPKCTLRDIDGALALGKFPSVGDERSVTRGEVLALRLARLAGIDAADARIERVEGAPVAVVRRFDRTPDGSRIPYLSGASWLQARRDADHAYTEVVDQMAGRSASFAEDARQLWRRIVFNHLVTNVDDHLRNLGFLYADRNLWRLAPAFDLNPFPDKDRESKTWLSEDTGPVTSVRQLLDEAHRFRLDAGAARAVLGEVTRAVSTWRELASSAAIGLTQKELRDFAPAFEHADLEDALRLAAG